MEHQIFPHGASYSDEDLVPYTALTDYGDVPFLEYSALKGYTFLRFDGSEPYIDTLILDRERPTADFI